jgi:SAM-dependent methyltransferase
MAADLAFSPTAFNNRHMYADYTRNTKEFLKSIAHSRRLDQAARIVKIDPSSRIFDYGCGDGAFFFQLNQYCPKENLFGYDPKLLGEMTFEGATTFDAVPDFIDSLAGTFDMIYCMEVCEHLSDAENAMLLDNVARLGKPGAVFIFGVPIETGFSAVLKNLFRWSKGGRQGANPKRILQTALSLPVEREWVDGWCGSHIGFNHMRFRKVLAAKGFRIQRTHCLPLRVVGSLLNNEIYFICTR